MKPIQVGYFRVLMNGIGFFLMVSGGLFFTCGVLVGKGYPGAFLAVFGEFLVVMSAINLKTAYDLRY